MRRVCIDTHALAWHLSRPKRLGRNAVRVLREADGGRVQVLVPALVMVELTLLREAGRKVVGVAEVESLFTAQPAFQILPFNRAQAREFALLGSVRDPFDRMIVAAARAEAVPLITADGEITDLGLVEVVWD